MDLGVLISSIIQLMSTLIFVWCLLTWFPTIRWYEQPFKTLDQVVQPIIAPFRKILPSVTGIDFSPLVTIIVLQVLANIVRHVIP